MVKNIFAKFLQGIKIWTVS